MTRYLFHIHNMQISYPKREIALFDDDASGAFYHAKAHPQVATAHACSVDHTLCMTVGSFFGDNVSEYNWEVFEKSR